MIICTGKYKMHAFMLFLLETTKSSITYMHFPVAQ